MIPKQMIRPSLCALFFLLLASGGPASANENLRPGDLVAVCGDSITEQKRYSLYVADYLLMCRPVPGLKTMQFGWSGERAPGFLSRMENDMLVFKPSVVTTCYGMNDGGYTAVQQGALDQYRKAMTDIVRKLKQAGVRFIVVGSPGVVDADMFKRPSATAEVYNNTLAALARVAREVAEAEGVAFADVHGAMADVMARAKARFGPQYHVAGNDGVHPAVNGHLVMAYAFLKALGCDGDIGTITVDMADGKAQATGEHTITGSSKDEVTVQSRRYPFCFFGTPDSPDGTRSIEPFLLFNQELNRFLLVVKNPPAQKLKVTWGNASKDFSAEELQEGINLAAEFPDNPFSAPFQTVEKKLADQQAYETPAIKSMMHSLLDWKEAVPSEQEAQGRMRQQLVSILKSRTEASSAAVPPVTHTIRMAPAE